MCGGIEHYVYKTLTEIIEKKNRQKAFLSWYLDVISNAVKVILMHYVSLN